MLFNEEGHIVTDNWQRVDIDADFIGAGDLLASWNYWDLKRDDLIDRRARGLGKIGVQIAVEDPFENVIQDLSEFSLIVLYFDKFTDGRHFSQASLLRRRYEFSGELRAAGAIHRDQLAYLRRVGFSKFSFDSCSFGSESNLSTDSFSDVYQGAADGLTSVRALRAASR